MAEFDGPQCNFLSICQCMLIITPSCRPTNVELAYLTLKNIMWLEIQGHSASLEMAPFNRLHRS